MKQQKMVITIHRGQNGVDRYWVTAPDGDKTCFLYGVENCAVLASLMREFREDGGLIEIRPDEKLHLDIQADKDFYVEMVSMITLAPGKKLAV